MSYNPKANRKQTVLITGVSSGVGLGLAKKLTNEGHHVYGSLRSSELENHLCSTLGNNFTPLIFDICSSKQIGEAQEKLKTLLSGQSLDVLINNAGTAEIGALLHTSPEKLLHHLDILAVGQLRVIQAFHPLMVGSNNTAGRIFNISSVSGVWPNLFFGGYSAGKHALEGLSKTLREELQIFGTKVVVVAPGNIATEIWNKQTRELVDEYKNTSYHSALTKRLDGIQNNIAQEAMTIEEFCTLFLVVFNYLHPADRYTIMKCQKWRYPFSLLTKTKGRIVNG